jgi:hypothetical protein
MYNVYRYAAARVVALAAVVQSAVAVGFHVLAARRPPKTPQEVYAAAAAAAAEAFAAADATAVVARAAAAGRADTFHTLFTLNPKP